MPELETADAAASALPEDLVEIGSYASVAAAAPRGLVVLAMRHPYWIVPSAQGVRLLVEPAIASAARQQLNCFERESVGWPPPPLEAWPGRPLHLVTPLLWSLVILAALRALEVDARAGGRRGDVAGPFRRRWHQSRPWRPRRRLPRRSHARLSDDPTSGRGPDMNRPQ